ncbi:cytochrome P450 [Pyruvatibacter mobilis]|jgi:cytochrome P450|uniref:Cytochrome P450 n=1 Tax=Pyruvatibacter mobilis TaxID=1712261 RepID=A0A845Q9R1_9HYPH|nr:cytochrome P450 [Pyruvatibacter mobilis]NBG95224.1 cytochrome P450 [Pyruvatibacter mobilis]QJD76402.1 cytochrome P450 [Pyruvatibacter mobilis]GGD23721.1 cytochrome P450 [Pyruvatibacter mobilis]
MSQAFKQTPPTTRDLTPKTNVADPVLWENYEYLPIFAKMRAEDPVHYCAESPYGAYWSVTRYEDIMAVDTNHHVYSSDAHLGGIIIDDAIQNDPDNDFKAVNFIAMDQPRHDEQRKSVNGITDPKNLEHFGKLIRQRTSDLLDSLPVGEEFDWVPTVSIELTTQMLATMFDFPFEDRHKLVRWSDVSTAEPGSGVVESQQQRIEELMEMAAYFADLQQSRKDKPDNIDLLTMMTHHPAMANMPPEEFLGNLSLLIVGGNDTTRNSMTGGVFGFNLFPDEFDKMVADPKLIDNAVAEIIRWQTPLAHMRRTALEDAVLGGKQIRKGDKVVMWYVSGNRDTAIFDDPDRIIIDRKNARRHLSFGFGIHRCMGNRIGELQLRILWEEILKRFSRIEAMGDPTLTKSNFVKGYTSLPVKLHRL